MIVVDTRNKSVVSLPAKALSQKQLRAASSPLAQRILHELAKEPMYPMGLAKKLRLHEQKVYYHVRNLEKAGIISVVKKEEVKGSFASFYAPTAPAFVMALREPSETRKIPGLSAQSDDFLSPIIENGELNGIIVVGSPDPHGPEMARSRDGYYGIDLALCLGTFVSGLSNLSVRLDTEVRSEELQKNLILIGGPVVNMVTQKVNEQLPIFFDKGASWAIRSTLSGKVYPEGECGLIVKAKNPFNPKKWVLLVAGRRYAGTRAVTMAFLRYFSEVAKGNSVNPSVCARVVEGLDRDADGVVDDVKFVE